MQRKPNREQLYAPYDWYRQMRETQPVYYDPDWRAWHVFRYADVARVLNDYTTFSSDENRYVPAGYRDSSPISSSILRMDPRVIANCATWSRKPSHRAWWRNWSRASKRSPTPCSTRWQ